MRDNYVGDVGDLANNGLLRWLSGIREVPSPPKPLRLGIVWYYNNVNERGRDGNILPTRDLRECDPALFDRLVHISANDRTVQAVIQSDILPQGTLSHREAIPVVNRGTVQHRQEWLQRALQETLESELVFVNPDNGLAGKTKRIHHRDGHKYATIEELRCFTCRGKSLILYQHPSRKKAPEQIQDSSQRLRRELGLPVRTLWLHSQAPRFYFIAIQSQHREYLENRLQSLARSRWCYIPRFTIVPEP